MGELTGFLSYVLQIMNSLMMLSNVFLLLTRSLASASRIAEVLEGKRGYHGRRRHVRLQRWNTATIEFDHVSL